MAYLEIKNLRKSFGSTEVLKGIDFQMEEGEVIAVIGSSGGGKTTFLRCLNFLEIADSGTIEIEGAFSFDAEKQYSAKERREMGLKMGLVFQQFNLFPQYSALQNVYIPKFLRDKERIKAEMPFGRARREKIKTSLIENKENAKAILIGVGLGDKAANYPCQLSGGQQQRVAIARALAQEPAILCFDEPTSALDPELTGEVLRVIRELKEQGRTMIIVTHEMEFARHVADRIIFFADGIIEEDAAPEDFFNNPTSQKTASFLRHAQE